MWGRCWSAAAGRGARGAHGARQYSSSGGRNEKNEKTAYILGAVVVSTVGLSYAAVPLYRMFCQATGYGGTTSRAEEDDDRFTKTAKNDVRPFRVTFESSVSANLPWSFEPVQKDVVVVPGSSMLAFFRAKNNSDEPLVGVSTYNVQPSKAGLYFVKIQCFCFEEQRLAPGEEVDMPVFFYVDPDILDDERLKEVNSLTLSYTFFRAKEQYD